MEGKPQQINTAIADILNKPDVAIMLASVPQGLLAAVVHIHGATFHVVHQAYGQGVLETLRALIAAVADHAAQLEREAEYRAAREDRTEDDGPWAAGGMPGDGG